MSLITRCPACQTMFRVVPDQLRISDGWVRCGQCEEIFDASLHLLPDQPDDVLDHWPQPLRESDTPEITEYDRPEVEPEPEPEPSQERASDDMPELAMDTGQPSLSEEAPEAEQEEQQQVSFLKTGNGHTFWSRTGVRWIMGLLGLMLMLGLTVQVLVHERNRIVALEPSTKPWMQTLCDSLDCTLAPLRRIESIVIESSSFARARGESHRLSFVLKNTADFELAIPSMELTLTDAQDQVVTRRVLAPSELGATATALAVGAEWSAAVDLAVDTGSKTERVAGYRLLAFYP